MSVGTHDVKSEIKKYMAVFAGLLILTIVTVAVSNLKIGISLGIVVALVIATVKGAMVACNFMHLTSEKKLIYFVLIMTGFFFLAMILLFYCSYFDLPEGSRYVP
jgi:cytochrome c oxidase subunit 4